MGPAGVNRAQGPGRRLVLTLQVALHYEAVRVIGEGTGLEANDVLTLCGPHDVDGVGRDHTLLEYHVGVAAPICVREEDLIPLLQLVEVPEHEVALRPRITNPVARDVDVGHIVPRKADRKSTRLNSSHTVIYTLSLHDALPISSPACRGPRTRGCSSSPDNQPCGPRCRRWPHCATESPYPSRGRYRRGEPSRTRSRRHRRRARRPLDPAQGW